MNVQNPYYRDITDALQHRQLFHALTQLEAWIATLSNWELSSRLEEIRSAYQSLLHYYAQGVTDSKRFEMFARFCRQTYSLTQAALRISQLPTSSTIYCQTARTTSIRQLEQLISDLENKQQQIIFSDLTGKPTASKASQLQRESEDIASRIFLTLWTSEEWSETTFNTCQRLFQSSSVTDENKSFFVSAVTLALNQSLDAGKLLLLVRLYQTLHGEPAERALIGITLTAVVHGKFLHDFLCPVCPRLNDAISEIVRDSRFRKNLESVQTLLLNAQDTEKNDREIQEHIMPGIIKTSMKDGKPMNFEDIEEMMDDSEDFTKYNNPSAMEMNESVRQLMELQRNGADLFFSSFRHMKNHPFFSRLPHWFLPFIPWQADAAEKLSRGNGIIRTILESNAFCNSDMYSVTFLLSEFSEEQIKLMSSQIDETLAERFPQLRKKTPFTNTPETIRTKIIQDCYRFFKLHRYRMEFNDPFSEAGLILPDNPILSEAFPADATIKIATLAAKQQNWKRCLAFLRNLTAEATDAHTAILRAHALRNEGQYTEALSYYSRALTVIGTDDRLMRHMAHCHRAAGQPLQAARIYAQLSERHPDDAAIAYQYGVSLIDTRQWEAAIRQLQKSHYLNPGHVGSLRALAWSCLMNSDAHTAEQHYLQLLALQPSPQDYLNAGHAALALGNTPAAAGRYAKYHNHSSQQSHTFQIPEVDIRMLTENYHLSPDDLRFMTEYINSQLQ